MSKLVVALVHHPVLDREGEIVTTAMTNLDLHDMARSALAYGVEALHIVHPIEAQRELAMRIRDHWVTGSGGRRIPDRAKALAIVEVVPSLDELYARIAPDRASLEVWTTAATARHGAITRYADARVRLEACEKPVVLLFGTGWGLAPSILEDADVRLEPIVGAPGSTYNHLSVRAACAISLDRLRA